MSPAIQRFVKVVAGSVGLSCGLGVAVDLMSANVAVEYFTVHHPKIVASNNPFVMAQLWGVGASWWFGASAGIVVAWINHRRRSTLAPRRILKWVATACAVLWLVMTAILLAVFAIAGTIPVDRRPPDFDLNRRLMSVAMAHQYEYASGAFALLVIAIMTLCAGHDSSPARYPNVLPSPTA